MYERAGLYYVIFSAAYIFVEETLINLKPIQSVSAWKCPLNKCFSITISEMANFVCRYTYIYIYIYINLINSSWCNNCSPTKFAAAKRSVSWPYFDDQYDKLIQINSTFSLFGLSEYHINDNNFLHFTLGSSFLKSQFRITVFIGFFTTTNLLKVTHVTFSQAHTYTYIYEVRTISFQTFFVWTLLLIVHTWNSSPLQSNLL